MISNIQKQLLNPWKLRWFLWKRLPSLLYWRVRLSHLDDERATVKLPFTKRSQNPFRSVYFAAQAGAAEFSTGVLAISAIGSDRKASMLVTGMRAEFFKKADTDIVFECHDGVAVTKTVKDALETGEGRKITMLSEGKNRAGEVVSKFWIEWSFKARTAAK